MKMNLVVRNARLRGNPKLKDIGITDGKIVKIADKINEGAANEIDAGGNLTTPSFVNTHVHLDKADTGKWAEVSWDHLETVIGADASIKAKSTHEDTKRRATGVVKLGAIYGTTKMRGFADVDTLVELKSLKAILEVKKELERMMDIQVCAFAQEGFGRNPGTYDLLCKAAELGAEVVGGIPWLERSFEESFRTIDQLFEIARRYDKDLHFLDNTVDRNARNLEYIAIKAADGKFSGRVTVSSAPVLSIYEPFYAEKVISLLRQAQVNFSTNIVDNVQHGRNWPQPTIRGITRVKDLLKAGVNVSCGQDDVNDTFYAFGRNDMLENALFLAHSAMLDTPEGIETVYDMITWRGAKTLRISDYGLEEGRTADLVVLDAPTVHQALRMQAARRYVIKKGKVIAESKTTTKLYNGS